MDVGQTGRLTRLCPDPDVRLVIVVAQGRERLTDEQFEALLRAKRRAMFLIGPFLGPAMVFFAIRDAIRPRPGTENSLGSTGLALSVAAGGLVIFCAAGLGWWSMGAPHQLALRIVVTLVVADLACSLLAMPWLVCVMAFDFRRKNGYLP